jgi:hypothetical protein
MMNALLLALTVCASAAVPAPTSAPRAVAEVFTAADGSAMLRLSRSKGRADWVWKTKGGEFFLMWPLASHTEKGGARSTRLLDWNLAYDPAFHVEGDAGSLSCADLPTAFRRAGPKETVAVAAAIAGLEKSGAVDAHRKLLRVEFLGKTATGEVVLVTLGTAAHNLIVGKPGALMGAAVTGLKDSLDPKGGPSVTTKAGTLAFDTYAREHARWTPKGGAAVAVERLAPAAFDWKALGLFTPAQVALLARDPSPCSAGKAR